MVGMIFAQVEIARIWLTSFNKADQGRGIFPVQVGDVSRAHELLLGRTIRQEEWAASAAGEKTQKAQDQPWPVIHHGIHSTAGISHREKDGEKIAPA